jgi:subtilase family serine protease
LCGALFATPNLTPHIWITNLHGPGEPFDIWAVTENRGDTSTGMNTTTRVYVNGTPMQDFEVRSLGPNGDDQHDHMLYTCPDTPTTLPIMVSVDLLDDVDESNENDNSITTFVQCRTPEEMRPDLLIGIINAPRAMNVGQAYAASITTRNNGLAMAGTSTTRILFDGQLVSDATVLSIPPGFQRTSIVQVTCRRGGPSRITAIADYLNSNNETNETNNARNLNVMCFDVPQRIIGNDDTASSIGKEVPKEEQRSQSILNALGLSLNLDFSKLFGGK